MSHRFLSISFFLLFLHILSSPRCSPVLQLLPPPCPLPPRIFMLGALWSEVATRTLE